MHVNAHPAGSQRKTEALIDPPSSALNPQRLGGFMFTTVDRHQMDSVVTEALEGTKSWSAIEITHQLPWFYATFIVRIGGQMRPRFLLTFSVAELDPSKLVGAEAADLLSVMLVSPPGLSL